jgi:hypothetical protein
VLLFFGCIHAVTWFGNVSYSQIHSPLPTHRIAAASNAERPLGMSVVVKSRRAVIYQGCEGESIVLDFCWMFDESLVACVKIVRSGDDPFTSSSSLDWAEYVFFKRVAKEAVPSSPFRVITVSKVTSHRKKRRLEASSVGSSAENRSATHPYATDTSCLKSRALAQIMALENESIIRVVFAETRNKASPGLPPRRVTKVVSWPVPFLDTFHRGTVRQAAMLRHLVIARIAQNGTFLSYSNRVAPSNAGCAMLGYGGSGRYSEPANRPDATGIIGWSEPGGTFAPDFESESGTDDLIDVPYIGAGPPSVRDFHFESPEHSPPSPIVDIAELELPNGRLPVAWCSECQNYASLSQTRQNANWDRSVMARPRCADCGAAFSIRAVRSRHFREVDILAACREECAPANAGDIMAKHMQDDLRDQTRGEFQSGTFDFGLRDETCRNGSGSCSRTCC